MNGVPGAHRRSRRREPAADRALPRPGPHRLAGDRRRRQDGEHHRRGRGADHGPLPGAGSARSSRTARPGCRCRSPARRRSTTACRPPTVPRAAVDGAGAAHRRAPRRLADRRARLLAGARPGVGHPAGDAGVRRADAGQRAHRPGHPGAAGAGGHLRHPDGQPGRRQLLVQRLQLPAQEPGQPLHRARPRDPALPQRVGRRHQPQLRGRLAASTGTSAPAPTACPAPTRAPAELSEAESRNVMRARRGAPEHQVRDERAQLRRLLHVAARARTRCRGRITLPRPSIEESA